MKAEEDTDLSASNFEKTTASSTYNMTAAITTNVGSSDSLGNRLLDFGPGVQGSIPRVRFPVRARSLPFPTSLLVLDPDVK